nr:hypothetical protein [Tanacetum cinerariifolium]
RQERRPQQLGLPLGEDDGRQIEARAHRGRREARLVAARLARPHHQRIDPREQAGGGGHAVAARHQRKLKARGVGLRRAPEVNGAAQQQGLHLGAPRNGLAGAGIEHAASYEGP